MTNEEKNAALPPKTCSVERLVTAARDVEKVINHEKTATRRNGRYADIGEIMELQGKRFIVTDVYRQTLGEMTDDHAAQEGYGNLDTYKEAILSFHPGMPWASKMKVWVHEFAPIDQVD